VFTTDGALSHKRRAALQYSTGGRGVPRRRRVILKRRFSVAQEQASQSLRGAGSLNLRKRRND
jgi:hypothetical protein